MKTRLFRTRNLIILLAALVVILVLLVFGQSFVRDSIVLPAEYFVWLGGLAIKAVPQYVFWAVLILLAVIIVIRSLTSGNKRLVENSTQSSPHNRSERVAYWASQVRLLEGGSYSRQRFAETFGKLILDILTHTGKIKSREFASHVEMVENNTLDLPLDILTFLKIRLSPFYDDESPGFFIWILELIGLKHPPEVPDGVIDENVSLHQELNQAVVYLEHELEVYSNQNGN